MALSVILLMTVVGLAASQSVPSTRQPESVDFMAGQYIHVGYLKMTIENNGADFCVEYDVSASPATGNWVLKEVQLHMTADSTTFPQTKNGNWKIGNFDYNINPLPAGTQTHKRCVTFTSLFGTESPCDRKVYVLAHAAVTDTDPSSPTYQNAETAWGSVIVKSKGNWGTFFDVTIGCDPAAPPPADQASSSSCETTWSYRPSVTGTTTKTFTQVNSDITRWGWVLGLSTTATTTPVCYEFDTWGGAAQNDITKGTDAGETKICYGPCSSSSCEVTVEFLMNNATDCARLNQWQVRVSLEENVRTAAPGQFEYKVAEEINPMIAYKRVGPITQACGSYGTDDSCNQVNIVSGQQLYFAIHGVACFDQCT